MMGRVRLRLSGKTRKKEHRCPFEKQSGTLFGFGMEPSGFGERLRAFRISGSVAERTGAVVIGFALRVISGNDSLFQHGAEFHIDGVNDITICSVRVLAAGHHDKELVSGVDDFDIVNGKGVIEGHGNDRFHRTVIKKLSDFDICDCHGFTSFQLT